MKVLTKSLVLAAILTFALPLPACMNTPNPAQPVEEGQKGPTAPPAVREAGDLTSGLELRVGISASPAMKTGRAAHTASLLPDGTVLLTGGFASGEHVLSSAERFIPDTNAFRPTGSMSEARQSHTATLLPDGRVLIAGGYDNGYLKSAELYDPQTGVFSPAGELTEARSGHIAVLLQDGRVLIAGGTGVGWSFLASAELYDPKKGTFSPTGNMTIPRESHTATLLPNGAVLVTGGHQGRRANLVIYDSAELYDPLTGGFTETGRMTVKRHKHDATLLADGRVFISGGSDERDSQGAYRSTEIYNPTAGAFTAAGDMVSARYKHTGTSLLLGNGEVLLVGGADEAELFDPQSRTFRGILQPPGGVRLFATATLLADGDILFAGGYGDGITSTSGSLRLTVDTP